MVETDTDVSWYSFLFFVYLCLLIPETIMKPPFTLCS